MTQEYEIPKPVTSISKNERIGFNAKFTINPSLRLARLRNLPMSGTIKDFSIGTTYTTIECFGGVILTIPNHRNIQVIHSVKDDFDNAKPQSKSTAETFRGVSIE
ncbi:hypothetical protein SPB21_27640 [Leptothoe sp. ISB3NOV94-8A]